MPQKIIYVKTPKAAGTSLMEILSKAFFPFVEIYVETKCWPDRQSLEKANLIILGEVVAKKFKKKHPGIWASAFSFAVVRNPYDKTISAWKYCKSTQNKDLKHILSKSMPRNKFWTKDNHDYIHFSLSQSSFLVSDDKLIIDKIFRFEDLITGQSNIFESLGLASQELPHRNKNRSLRDDFQDYLTSDIINLINKRYSEDFDFFGYKKKLVSQTPSLECQWSIGIYEGVSPFALHSPDKITNPIIAPCDVSDAPARLVADPFGVRYEDKHYLFFEAEVKTENGYTGKIAVASSENGATWHYEKIVLNEPFHLSYPYVFIWDNHFYLIPEARHARQIRLYRAASFPFHWELDTILLKGKRFADNSLFFYNDTWWLFTDSGNSTLRLYFSRNLKGPYKQHPKSPIRKKDPHSARPAGRVILYQNNPIRFAQDAFPIYGSKVWGFKITVLTTKDYQEEPIASPVLEASGFGWNSHGMHTVDATQLPDGSWRAYVDGYGSGKASV